MHRLQVQIVLCLVVPCMHAGVVLAHSTCKCNASQSIQYNHNVMLQNELAILEFIHCLVETLDRYFSNVCELDLMFNLEMVSRYACHNETSMI